MSIADNLKRIEGDIARAAQAVGRGADEVELLPVTKAVDVAAVQELYAAGCRSFGENRIEVLNSKRDSFPPETKWHFIGTLQRKKIRKILGASQIIHSVESLKLAEKISQVAQDMAIEVEIFLELNNGEEQKGGFSPQQLCEEFATIAALPNITIIGLMTMAPFSDDDEIVRSAFAQTRQLRDELNALGVAAPMTQLSMGMSNDFEIAIAEGSTLVRVGTALYR